MAFLYNKFQKLDIEKDNRVSPSRFRILLRAAFGQGLCLSRLTFYALSFLLSSGDDLVSPLFPLPEPTADEVRDFFQRFDLDKDGFISWEEFLHGSFRQPSKIRVLPPAVLSFPFL